MAIKKELSKDQKAIPEIVAATKEEQNIEQEGLDMEYQIDLKTYKDRESTYRANKYKAYTIILNYSNKTLQKRIEEAKDFESNVRNDPLKLLEQTK